MDSITLQPDSSAKLTTLTRFMAASKVLGEESVREQAQQQSGGQK